MTNTYITIPDLSNKDVIRFWDKITIYWPRACWNWIPRPKGNRYGRYSIAGKSINAQRIAYFLYYKIDPCELFVCHRCDNPYCCNPLHLFLGTNQENTADKVSKNRQAKGSSINRSGLGKGLRNGTHTHPETRHLGSQNGSSKLNENQVIEIRNKYKPRFVTQEQLAKEYSVDQTIVSDIILRKTWRHI